MFWKAVFVACLAVGALAHYGLTDKMIRDIITSQCKNNGAEVKIAEIKKANKTFIECTKVHIDPPTLRREYEGAKSRGTLNELFAKYCPKFLELKKCFNAIIDAVFDAVAPCVVSLDSIQIESLKTETSQLLDQFCSQDSDTILPHFLN